MGQCVSRNYNTPIFQFDKNINETLCKDKDEDNLDLLTFKNLGKGVYGYSYMSNGKVMKHIF
jgi:hypothetical protein